MELVRLDKKNNNKTKSQLHAVYMRYNLYLKIWLGIKQWYEETEQTNSNYKKAEMGTLMLDKINFKEYNWR